MSPISASAAAPSRWRFPSGSRIPATPARPPASSPPAETALPAHLFSVAVSETERLDRFLADQLSLSRTQAARLVAAKAVCVNEATARASRILARGDVVKVEVPDVDPPRTLAPHHVDIDVVFEDQHLAVIDKPAGLVVHPAPGHWNDTLVNALVARGTPLASGTAGRPGIVHRLDRDTSGLMVVAKSDIAHRRLAAAMAARKVSRTYAVLTWGHLAETPLRVDAAIARHQTDRKRMVVRADGRPARTDLTRVARFEVAELLRAELHSGRTHQIRVHCAHIGHPVVGDPVYGGGGPRRITGASRPLADRLDRLTRRQALHAAALRFAHPVTGERLVFRCEWPADLAGSIGLLQDVAGSVDSSEWLAYLGFFGSEDG